LKLKVIALAKLALGLVLAKAHLANGRAYMAITRAQVLLLAIRIMD
jgi:hypothetical protein